MHLGSRLLAGHRVFWLCLISIFVVAAAFRLLSFSFSLPYIDHPDEPSLYVQALALRGLTSPIPNMASYPPASLVQTDIVQRALESVGKAEVANGVYINRLLSVISNLFTLILAALLARKIAGDFAGIVAAAAWGLSPLVLENGVYALADPHVYMLATLSMYLAIVALLEPTRRHWVIGSTVAALVATLYKYPAVSFLLPGGLVTLWLLRTDRRAIRYLIAQGLMVAVVGFFLVVVYHAASLNVRVMRTASTGGGLIDHLLNPQRLIDNLWWLFTPLNARISLIVIGAGTVALALAYWLKRPRIKLVPALLCALMIVAYAWEISAFSTADTTGRIRDIMPVTPMACVLLGAAIGQIVWLLPMRLRWAGVVVAVAVFYVTMFRSQIKDSWSLVQDRQIGDRRVALFRWIDASLDSGTFIVNGANRKTFNPFYSGLQGQNHYDWWVVEDIDDLMERTVADWQRRGMAYAALEYGDWEALESTDAGRAYLDNMLYLRTLDEPEDGHGPKTVVYRLWTPSNDVDFAFGDDIRLVGYDASATDVKPGDTLELRFYWRADQTPVIDYSLFVHLTAPGDIQPLAQADGAPARSTRLTPTWNDPDETIISQPFSLQIPPDLAPGTYNVRIGLYDYVTGQRLPVQTDGQTQDNLTLLQIEVSAP